MPQSDPIDFWFSIGSMYTFLTVMRIDRVEDMTDVRFVYRPFSVRAIMIEMDNRPAAKPKKLEYMWRDLHRRAEMYGFAFEGEAPYPLKNFDLANRVAIVGAQEGWCADYVRATYRRWFVENQECGMEPNLSDSLARDRRGPGPRDRACGVGGYRARLHGGNRRGACAWAFLARRALLRAARCSGATTGWRMPSPGRSAARWGRQGRRDELCERSLPLRGALAQQRVSKEATAGVLGHPSRRPLRGLLRMRALALLLELQIRRLHDVGRRLDIRVDHGAEFLRRAAARTDRHALSASRSPPDRRSPCAASLRSFFTIGAGVAACTKRPLHNPVFTSARPASAMLGTSGNSAERTAPVTASAFTCPPFTSGTVGGAIGDRQQRLPAHHRDEQLAAALVGDGHAPARRS